MPLPFPGLPGLLLGGPSSSIGRCRPLSQRTALLLLMLSILLSSPSLHSTSPSDGSRTPSRRAVPFACAQQGGGDDGSQNSDQQDSMSPNDPNLINPPNKQGYGRNVRTDIVKTEPARKSVKTESKKSMAEQTTQAALQLGVLVGVSLLVGVIFFINIGIELLINHICDKVSDFFGRKKEEDLEEQDPASLVGTFKRYK